MEKIILSDVQKKLYSNYEERVMAFLKRKFLRKKIIVFLIFAPIVMVVLVVIFLLFSLFLSIPHGVTRFFSVIIGIASGAIPSYFADIIKYKLKDQLIKSFSFSLSSNHYEINFVDCSSFVFSIKKEELQNIFKEEAKKEIERINTITKEDLERIEKEGKGIYKHKVLKKMKKELEEILIKLEN